MIEPGILLSEPVVSPADAAISARIHDLQGQVDWLRGALPPPITDEQIGEIARRAVPPRDVFSYRHGRPDQISRIYVAGQLSSGSLANIMVDPDKIFALPQHLPAGMSIYQLIVNLHSAVGSDRSLRLAIYASAKGFFYPERLVWAGASQLIPSGFAIQVVQRPNRKPEGDRLYWFCFMGSDTFSMVSPDPDSMWSALGIDTASFNSAQPHQVGWQLSWTYANGYPNVFPSGATSLLKNGGYPAIGIMYQGAVQ